MNGNDKCYKRKEIEDRVDLEQGYTMKQLWLVSNILTCYNHFDVLDASGTPILKRLITRMQI